MYPYFSTFFSYDYNVVRCKNLIILFLFITV